MSFEHIQSGMVQKFVDTFTFIEAGKCQLKSKVSEPCSQSVSKFFNLFVGVLLLLTLSGSYLMLALAPVPEAVQDTQVPYQGETARLTSEQAIAVALNDLEATADGYRLSNPHHTASFTAQGVTFTPKRGGPAWSWQLTAVSAGGRPLVGARPGAVAPLSTGASVVAYERGALVEQYLAHGSSIEQQFVIPQSLRLGGADLVIEGAVQSMGQFEEAEDDWFWRAGTGAVHLGDVRVIDAAGEDLPASMQVTASTTRITVDGLALARATYPVTIDPEIGANDVRLSDMGQDDSLGLDAWAPAVAYNSTNNEYLVVWAGYGIPPGLEDAKNEIFGLRVNAATGEEIGDNLCFSDMAYDAFYPDVAYNSTDNEYLVVWWGDDDIPPLVVGEYEIHGQRVNAATGTEVGVNDFRISDMGPDGDHNYGFDPIGPRVAYNSTNNEYLVVWSGEDNVGSLVDDEHEILGQRIYAATGAEIGINDFRISDMGPDGDINYDAYNPAVAYNSINGEYLVVWRGDDNTGALVEDENEIYGQRVNAATGVEVGANDFRLSDMGPDGNTNYYAQAPDIVYNSTDNEYLVVWYGEDDTGSLVDGEQEIFGQLVDAATDQEIGTNDFRLSDMGPDGNTDYGAHAPAVTYNSTDNEYLVVWHGDDGTDGEDEIYGQRVGGGTGAQVGPNDFRISDMGPDGNTDYDAHVPALAYNNANSEYLVVWTGDDDTPPLVDSDSEIFGQRLTGADGSEVGENDMWLSHMVRDLEYDAYNPAVAYNSANNEFLVVWNGDNNADGLVDGEFEIYGQRVDAVTGEEIGVNDMRLSDMGPDGDPDYEAYDPAVAYNSTDNEYLVVWRGDDNTAPLVGDEFEIYGQRVDAASGAEVGGNDFRLSDMGPDGDTNYGVAYPAVAYNSTDNEYLVVWQGDDNTAPLVNGEWEIFGQRVVGTGEEVGVNDMRLSDMGPDGDINYDAHDPDVAYNSANDEYLVVWYGDDDTGDLVDNEYEIYGQRVDGGTGSEVGDNDIRLSDMGSDGDEYYGADYPAVAYNSAANEYLVVWYGDDNTAPLVENEAEIYGQRVNGADGVEVGENDFRLSDMGPEGDPDYDAFAPAVVYDSNMNEYLVVWSGDDITKYEFEIYGQRVNGADGAEVGENDFRLSDMGPNEDTGYGTSTPAVAYAGTVGAHLVVWCGDDNTDGMVDDEFEIFGQRFTSFTEEGITGLTATNDGPTPLGSLTTLTATITAGSNVSYTWAFGDGGSDDGAVVTYTYATAGVYTAVVTASNSISISTATTQVTVTEESGYVVYLPLVVKNE